MQLTRRSLLVGAAATVGATSVAFCRPATRPGRVGGYGQASTAALNVRNLGARGDGVHDDRPAIQAAIDTMAQHGGGTVFVPQGTYVVSRAPNSAVAISLKSGVTLQGQGAGSVLKLQDGVGGHTLNIAEQSNCAIRDMVIDGNRERQPSVGHTVRTGGVDGLLLSNLIIRNAYHYGIGLEAGSNRNVRIDQVTIQNTGGDGIDIKNKDDNDSGIQLSNVTVSNWGLNTTRQTQAAIDLRGPVRLSNIRISNPGAFDAVGVRMRQGDVGNVNGIGGHYSQLDGFDIRMGNGRAQRGIDVVARDVTVANGTISGGNRGLVVQEVGFQGRGIIVQGCSGSGILVSADNPRFHGNSAIFSDCRVADCGETGIDVEADGVQLIRCASHGSRGPGLFIRNGAKGTTVNGGDFRGNAGPPVIDRGLGSRVAALAG